MTKDRQLNQTKAAICGMFWHPDPNRPCAINRPSIEKLDSFAKQLKDGRQSLFDAALNAPANIRQKISAVQKITCISSHSK